MKPILACDAEVSKLKFPLVAMPKIDGVRALNVDERLVGRSGKQFKNKLNTAFYSDSRFNGLDGEMVCDRVFGYGICNETTSALGTIKGEVETNWCLFDYVVEGMNDHLPYVTRYQQLISHVTQLIASDPSVASRLWIVPAEMVYCREHLNDLELRWITQGYEGVILREPEGIYKFGRSTANEGYFLRVKRFLDAEIEITAVVEGKSNQNELKHNPHGYAERSTVADGMVPNGMVGTIVGRALEDVVWNKRTIIYRGDLIEVSPGKMTHADRRYYFEHTEEIVGLIAKYQFFPVGIKDKPRFPTFQGFRDPVDMS